MRDTKSGHRQQRGPLARQAGYQRHASGLVLALLIFACAGERALVERLENETWRPAPFHLVSFSGQRDGTHVAFAIELKGEENRRLLVRGTVIIDPQAHLLEGHWVEQGGSAPRSGILSSAAVDFLGGQGGRPSLGGQFTLSGENGPLYRLNLTSHVLEPPAE
ncbi:MAG: hypothetical protein E2P03_02355 [Acidobacteria bacterium]|nr:MAG: hypothetical protein E2P03_02355 [Acidobacteriota bacterium]